MAKALILPAIALITKNRTTGDATGNDRLKAEGQKDQASGNLKQAGENVKDVFK